MNDVDLAIKLTADARDAQDAFDQVGDAAGGMAQDVEAASRKADDAAGRMGGLADSADNVDSKMSGATAALGALSGGLEAAGFGPAASALQGVAIATDTLGGAGQALNLVLESQAVMTARAKAAAVAKAATDKVVAASTKAWAATQWLLNAALSANPIGLVVVAVAALVAGIVLAYNKSETFRNIVQTTMKAAQTAVGWVVDKVKDMVDPIVQVIKKLPDMSGAFELAKTLITGYLDLVLAPLRAAKDVVEWIIGHLKDIHVPKAVQEAADLLHRTSATTAAVTPTAGSPDVASGTPVAYVTVQGALDPTSVADQLDRLLRRRGIAVGGRA